MRLILGLDDPTSGSVTINGRPYRELPTPLRSVGTLLDPNAVDPKRSAANHLTWLARSNGIDVARVDEALGLVGLSDVGGRRVGGFSLGMHQRLGLAAALLGDPETLLFDEPLNGLDPEGIVWLRSLLRSLADQGRTVFVSSHLMNEMAQTADQVVVIGRGRLIAESSMAEIITIHGRSRVRVRALDRQPELDVLVEQRGGAVRLDRDGIRTVTGLPSSAIGQIAAAHGIPLAELTPQAASLEDIFMELTKHDTNYRAVTGPTAYGVAA